MRLFVSAPVLVFCIVAGSLLVRRWKLGGWTAVSLGTGLAIACVAFCEWQVRPLLHGNVTSIGTFSYLFAQIIMATNAASRSPIPLLGQPGVKANAPGRIAP